MVEPQDDAAVGDGPARECLVWVRGLRYRYPDGTVALDGVDFCLRRDEVVAVLGANGSGKSTFALHLNGLLTGEGEVWAAGLPVKGAHLAAVRQKIGFLFQDPDEQLFLSSVWEDVTFGPLSMGCSPEQARQRAEESLRRVEMWGVRDRAPHHLSAGEKRRVALAGVLAMRPELLVLDEPTTYLDPPGLRDLAGLLRGVRLPMIVITHDVAFARAFAQRAVFFEKGRVVGEGTVDAVVERFQWSPGY